MSDVCEELHRICNEISRFTFPFECGYMPRNGIYVLFESGERAHGSDRIVRIGTHTGDNQLRSRLRQHFIEKKQGSQHFSEKHRARFVKQGWGSVFETVELGFDIARQTHEA